MVMSSNVLFYLPNNPNPQNTQPAMINDKEKHYILSLE